MNIPFPNFSCAGGSTTYDHRHQERRSGGRHAGRQREEHAKWTVIPSYRHETMRQKQAQLSSSPRLKDGCMSSKFVIRKGVCPTRIVPGCAYNSTSDACACLREALETSDGVPYPCPCIRVNGDPVTGRLHYSVSRCYNEEILKSKNIPHSDRPQ
jgi:hypothetical protein